MIKDPAVMLFIAAVVLFLVALTAEGHEWYDAACCNDRDCRAISDAQLGWSEVELTAQGYVWTSSQSGRVHVFKEAEVKPSRDGNFHGCETPMEGHKLCLYVPTIF